MATVVAFNRDQARRGAKGRKSEFTDLRAHCAHAPRVSVRHQQIAENPRAWLYALLNCFVSQQRIMNDALGMGPAALTVFLTVKLASVQKLVRQRSIPVEFRGIDALPIQLVGVISRRAVAAASGLPRETVRRLIGDLVDAGHLVESGRGVTVRPDCVRHEHIEGLPSMLAAEVQKLIGELQRLGAIAAS